MSALEQKVFQSNITIDENLNIIKADSNFYRFVNHSIVENLSNYLDSSETNYLLESINKQKSDVVVNFNVRNTSKECIIKVVKKGSYYHLTIYNFKDLIARYEKETLQYKKGVAILSLIDILFFDFELSTCKVLISSGKALEVIKEFDVKDILSELASYFNVQGDNINLIKLDNDIKNEIYNKEYNIGSFNILTTPLFDETSKVINVMGVISNNDNQIKTRGFYNLDGLTQILNKNAIIDLAMTQIGVLKNEISMFVIDIDNFKDINDTYGHLFGDEVLIKAAKVIKDAVGDDGYVGRFGGDEFVVVYKKTDEESLRDVLRNIKLGIQWSYSSEMKNFIITCSTGCARFPLDAANYDELFFLADKCLYLAKRKGRNCYIIYRKDKHEQIVITKDEMHRNIINTLELHNSIEQFTGIIQKYKEIGAYQTLEQVKNAIKADRVTIYVENKLDKIIGERQTDDRIINSNYYRFFNNNGILVNDNINQYEVSDKKFFLMYYEHEIVGSIEIKFECQNKEYLICFDKIGKNNAKAWVDTDVSFVLLIVSLLKDIL